MTFIPSPQQNDFFKAVALDSDNLILEAVAGAGKTTTLIKACELLRGKSVGFAAYNTKIAKEIGQKTRDAGLRVDSNTFHSYGRRVLAKMAPNALMGEEAEAPKQGMMLMNVPEEYRAFVKRSVSLAKQNCLAGNSAANVANWQKIVQHYALDAELIETGTTVEKGIGFAQQALQIAFDLRKELIDFDDMIWLPAISSIPERGPDGKAVMWRYDVFMVDEAQDSNPARRILARKLTRQGGRTFFVGDRHQAIYGFTGADNNSMDIIAKEFNCRKLPLTVTYRCPKKVVEVARRYVTHITAHETAPEGEVQTVAQGAWAFERPKLQAGDAILCRKTKPLVDEAYALIRAKIPCHVEGRDIGKGLLNLTNKWARVKTVSSFLDKLEDYTAKQVAKFMAKEPKQEAKADAAKDQLETMKVLCEKKLTLEQVRADIMDLFKDTQQGDVKDVTLSTVHKSKGREWHNVYVLGFKEFMPLPAAKLDWEIAQEQNLIYVAVTRAQSRLVLVG